MDNDKKVNKKADYLSLCFWDEKYYKLFNLQKKSVIKKYLKKLILHVESNDTHSFRQLLSKIEYLNKFKNIPSKYIDILIINLDKIITANYKDFTIIIKPVRMLTKYLRLKKKTEIHFDWRIYYKISVMLFNKSNLSDIRVLKDKNVDYDSIFQRLLANASKHFKYREGDYEILKEETIRYLYSENNTIDIEFALGIIYYFIPTKELSADSEFQGVLFKLFSVRSEYSVFVLSIFKKLLKVDLKIEKSIFINKFFSILINYFSFGANKMGSFIKYKKSDTQKYSLSKHMSWILVMLLLDKQYESMSATINKHFNVLINFMNLNLQETPEQSKIETILSMVKNILSSIKIIAFRKEEIQLTELEYDKVYHPLDTNKSKIQEIITYLIPIIIKCIIYQDTISFRVIAKLQCISEHYPIRQEILESFKFLLNESENDYSNFINKLNSFIKVFLSYDNLNDHNVFKFFIEVIKISVEKITSAKVEQNVNIIVFFINIYSICGGIKNEERFKTSHNFLILLNLLNELSVDVTVRLTRLFEFVACSKIKDVFAVFLFSASYIISPAKTEEIVEIFTSYGKENILSDNCLNSFYTCLRYILQSSDITQVKKDKYFILWEYAIDAIMVTSTQGKRIKNDHCLVDFDLCTAVHNIDDMIYKKLKYFRHFTINFHFENFLNQTTQKDIVEICSLLLNEKDSKYHKLGLSILEKVVNTLLSRIKSKDDFYKSTLASKKDIEFIFQLYSIFLSPYFSFIQTLNDKYLQFMSGLDSSLSKKLIKSLCSSWIKTAYPEIETLRIIIVLFLRIESIFTKMFDNPFLLRNNILNTQILEDDDIKEDAEQYVNLCDIRFKHLEFTLKFYDCLKNCRLLKYESIHKYYLRELLNQCYDPSRNFISKNADFIDKLRDFFKFLKKNQLPLVEYSKYLQSFYCHLRYFKVDSRPERPYITQERIILISKLFISSFDKKKELFLHDVFSPNLNKLSKSEWKTIYATVHNKIISKIKKIIAHTGNQPFTLNDRNKLSNMLYVYIYLYRSIFNCNYSMIPMLISDSHTILSVLGEKKFNEKIIKTLYTEVCKCRYDLQRCSYFFDVKMTTFPFLNELCHISATNSRAEKYRVAVKESACQVMQKIEERKVKLGLDFNGYFMSFLELMELNDSFHFNPINQLILLNTFNIMMAQLNICQEADYQILSRYEKYFYTELLSSKSTLHQKRVSISTLGSILKVKYKLRKTYKIEYVNQAFLTSDTIHSIIKSNLESHIVCFFNTPKYIVHKQYIDINHSKAIDRVMTEQLNSEDSLYRLFEALTTFKDLLNDQELLKNNKKGFQESGQDSQIFKGWEYKTFFYLMHLYGGNTIEYGLLFEIVEKLVKSRKADQSICTIVLLQFICAKVKNDIIFQKHENEIQPILNKIMAYFTDKKAKLINENILNFFSYVLKACTINDFQKYFKQSDGRFIFFNFGDNFVLQFFNLLCKIFKTRSHYIFNIIESEVPMKAESNLGLLHQIVECHLLNKVQLVKDVNNINIKYSIVNLFYSSRSAFYNPTEFTMNYNESAREYLVYLLNLSKDNDYKEIKHVMCHLIYYFQKYLINNSDLLIEYLMEAAKLTYLDVDKFFYYLDLRANFQLECQSVQIEEFLFLIESYLSKLDSSSNLNTKKFLVDFLINMVKQNLIQSIEDKYSVCVQSIFRMINTAPNEIKEYIMNNLLVFYINSSSFESNLQLINNLKKSILCMGDVSNEKKEENEKEKQKDDDEIVSMSRIFDNDLSILYVLGAYLLSFSLYIPEHIQDLIVFMKKLNINLFKNKGKCSNLIKKLARELINRYKFTYKFAKKSLSMECDYAIMDLSKTNSYFT